MRHGSKKWRLAFSRPCEPSGWLASGPKMVSERRVWAGRCLGELLRSLRVQKSFLDADFARLEPCRARLWKKAPSRHHSAEWGLLIRSSYSACALI